MSSADSRRVETEERRWWWEAGRAWAVSGGEAGEGAGTEGMELRERERRWGWRAKEWRGASPPILKE